MRFPPASVRKSLDKTPLLSAYLSTRFTSPRKVFYKSPLVRATQPSCAASTTGGFSPTKALQNTLVGCSTLYPDTSRCPKSRASSRDTVFEAPELCKARFQQTLPSLPFWVDFVEWICRFMAVLTSNLNTAVEQKH